MINLGKRNLNSQNHWSNISIDNFSLENPSVIIFGGNTTDDPSVANGYAKLIEHLTPNVDHNAIDLLAFHFDHEPFSAESLCLDKECITDLDKIFDNLFLPMLIDKYGNARKKQGISKSLQQITFFTHCGGTIFLNYIVSKITDTLSQIGFSNGEIKNLLKSVQVLSYAPYSTMDASVSSVYVAPISDPVPTWAKAMEDFREKRIDNAFPKGFYKQYLKQQLPGKLVKETTNREGQIVVKSGNSILIIPGVMLSKQANNHSPKCLASALQSKISTPEVTLAKRISSWSSIALTKFMKNSIKAKKNQHQPVDMGEIYDEFLGDIFGPGQMGE